LLGLDHQLTGKPEFIGDAAWPAVELIKTNAGSVLREAWRRKAENALRMNAYLRSP
jgi:hypothetical protein